MDPREVSKIVRRSMKDIDREYELLCTSWWNRIWLWVKRNF